MKLIDNENTTLHKGVDCLDFKRVLLTNPADVTEEDEIKYVEKMKVTSWKGDLTIVCEFKYKGADDWNRPVFKEIDIPFYIGSVNILVPDVKLNLTNDKNITEYFKENSNQLEYFGSSFNCEPHGGVIKPKFEIL